MGLRYLDGKSWAEVTRDERYFCQRLFRHIEAHPVRAFIEYLNRQCKMSLDPEANWEPGYEACFYRDLWHFRGKQGELFSPKRTFDLCLFSDDVIVIIEAKAQQGFEPEQLSSFETDVEQVELETGVTDVPLVGLASSQYSPSDAVRAVFGDRYLTWAELAAHYGDDPELLRADAIYESTDGSRRPRLTGTELVKAYAHGESLYVGRSGGLDGSNFAEDVRTGGWKTQRYQVSQERESANWFSLADFVARVEGSNDR